MIFLFLIVGFRIIGRGLVAIYSDICLFCVCYLLLGFIDLV